MKNERSAQDKKAPQIPLKWAGGHSKGKLEIPANNAAKNKSARGKRGKPGNKSSK